MSEQDQLRGSHTTRKDLLERQKQSCRPLTQPQGEPVATTIFKNLEDGDVQLVDFGRRDRSTPQIDLGRGGVLDEPEVQAALESAKKRGHDEGREAGLAAGREAGVREGAKDGSEQRATELKDEIAACALLIQELNDARTNLLGKLGSDAIQLGIGIAEKILARHLDDGAVIQARLDEAINNLHDPAADLIQVRVAPSQLEHVRAIAQPQHADGPTLAFTPDPELETGDLIVSTSSQQIASIVSEQLSQIVEALSDD